MRAAEEQEDDLNGCPLQWLYCNLMLLAGSRPGHIITVSAFLAHVQKVSAVTIRMKSTTHPVLPFVITPSNTANACALMTQ